MRQDVELVIGDICGDVTGCGSKWKTWTCTITSIFQWLRVVKRETMKTESGEMSHVAFVRRFTKLGNTFAHRRPSA